MATENLSAPTPPPRSTEATLDVQRLQQILMIEVGMAEESLRSYRAATNGYDYSRAIRVAANDAEQCRALASQLPDLLAARASLSAAEQENERLWTQFNRVGATLVKACEQRDRHASEVEALASGKVWRNHPRMGWWVASDLEDANTLLGPFDSPTEALRALLGPSPEEKI